MDGDMYLETENGGHDLNLQQHHVRLKLQDAPERPRSSQQQQRHDDENVHREQQHGCESGLPSQQVHQQEQKEHAQQLVEQQQVQRSVFIPLAQHQSHQHQLQLQMPQQQQDKSAVTVHEQVVSRQESSKLTIDTSKPEGTTLWKQCSSCNMPIPLYMLQRHLAACQAPSDTKNSGNDLIADHSDGPGVFVCSICSKMCLDQDSIQEHEQSHRCHQANSQPGAIYMCSICCSRFRTTEELVKHVEVHLNGNQEQGSCQVCREVFQNPVNLLQHMEAHHGHLKACPCGAVFRSKQEFREHQDLCMPVLRDPTAATKSAKSYRCRLCPKIFGTVQSRLQHERVHRRSNGDSQMTSEKFVNKTEFVCNLCKQEFNCRENFRAHVRSHTGEKPYGCRHCLKSFSSLQGRWQHEKIHKR